MLDTVHNQGLRLALGAFRTSPVSSLNVEADEPSLWLRREKLSLQYAIRLAANPSNPAFEVTFPPQFQEYYERKPNAIKSFGLRIAPLLESANINTKILILKTSKNTIFLIFHPGALLNQLFFSIYTTAKSHFLIHIS